MPFVRAAAVSDVPDGGSVILSLDGHTIALFHVQGTFYALQNRCSHADASLGEGDVDGDDRTVECPLHGSLFDLTTGKPRTLPAYEPVRTYTVRVEHDTVLIDLP